MTGASGQDGYFLTALLLRDGWLVHATGLRTSMLDFATLSCEAKAACDASDRSVPNRSRWLISSRRLSPMSFTIWRGKAAFRNPFPIHFIPGRLMPSRSCTCLNALERTVRILVSIKRLQPTCSGTPSSGATVYNEDSALNPQSPYASAKAAAHLLCHSYREVYGLRIASGILSNHESHRRPASFLSRKVVEHVRRLKGFSESQIANSSPLAVGNLKIRRDWGFAPDYVEGMCRILRQIKTRAEVAGQAPESDEGANYRDYVLATGETHAVWELVDCAFTIGGFELEWDLEGNDPKAWHGLLSFDRGRARGCG